MTSRSPRPRRGRGDALADSAADAEGREEKLAPASKAQDDEVGLRAMKAVRPRDRIVEVQCPVHRDQVVAVLTVQGHLIDAGGPVDAAGATHVLMGICRKCGGDPDYRMDPAMIRAVPESTRTRPAKVTADKVLWHGRPRKS